LHKVMEYMLVREYTHATLELEKKDHFKNHSNYVLYYHFYTRYSKAIIVKEI